MKDFQAAGEAFSPSKRTSISSKHEISSLFPYFVGQFCSPGSGFQIRIHKPNWIRIRIHSADENSYSLPPNWGPNTFPEVNFGLKFKVQKLSLRYPKNPDLQFFSFLAKQIRFPTLMITLGPPATEIRSLSRSWRPNISRKKTLVLSLQFKSYLYGTLGIGTRRFYWNIHVKNNSA